eukprot:333432-Alexandrium_andersonii.AAC.1
MAHFGRLELAPPEVRHSTDIRRVRKFAARRTSRSRARRTTHSASGGAQDWALSEMHGVPRFPIGGAPM